MDYDSFHSAVGTVLILAAVLLCGLHLWFSAAMASVQKLGGQMSALAEDKPKMQYYLKHKNRLRITAVAEVISFTAILALAAYLLVFEKGWAHRWNPWVTLVVPALAALALVLILDGCARGLGRKQAEQMAEKSLGLVKLEALLLLPVYGIYEGMDCLAGGKRPAKEHVTEEDILHLVNAGNENGVIEEQQREMINNIFEFDDIPISDVMTHRKELVAVDVEQAISDVVQLAIEEKYSRNPGVRICTSLTDNPSKIMPTFRLDHHIHIFTRTKSRTKSDRKRCHIFCCSEIFLCKDRIHHNLRFQ